MGGRHRPDGAGRGRRYFREVESQVVAKTLAQEFNKRGPPKTVDFVTPYTLEMTGRENRPMFNVEPLMSGVYEKHNDNAGGVCHLR